MARYVVIGGNGFIGSHIVDELAKRGESVGAFDRFGGGRKAFDADVESIVGDFLNSADLRGAITNADVVVHCLSTTTPATADSEPILDITTNVAQSVRLFEICAEAGVTRVVYMSSGGTIYGNQAKRTFSENDLPMPTSPYAIGKLAIEGYLRYFLTKFGLDHLVLRISNPYGPRQHPQQRQGVVPIMLRRIASGEPVTVYGDGSMIRDYIYVGDVGRGIARMIGGPTRHRLYNVGSGVGISVNDVLRTIETVVGHSVKVIHQPTPSTFVDHVTLDVQRLHEEFGKFDEVSLEDGIRATWEEIARERL